MRVKSTSDDLLVIEDRPILAALFLVAFLLVDIAVVLALAARGEWAGVAMLGLGVPALIVALFIFVRRTIVFLDRPGNRATIRVATFRGQTETGFPLDGVIAAEVQVSRTSKTLTSRPALILPNGRRAVLTQVYSSGQGAAEVAAAINHWLPARQPQKDAPHEDA